MKTVIACYIIGLLYFSPTEGTAVALDRENPHKCTLSEVVVNHDAVTFSAYGFKIRIRIPKDLLGWTPFHYRFGSNKAFINGREVPADIWQDATTKLPNPAPRQGISHNIRLSPQSHDTLRMRMVPRMESCAFPS